MFQMEHISYYELTEDTSHGVLLNLELLAKFIQCISLLFILKSYQQSPPDQLDF